jgi:phosphocarrier protein
MIRRKTVIANRLGLHARAAAKLVQAANRYHSRVTISAGQLCVDAKSILGVLTLAAGKDTPVILEVDGPDEAGAAEALTALIGSGFGED